MEIWKPVVHLPTLYEVSNLGRVRNLKTGRILKGSRHKGGYQVFFPHLGSDARLLHILVLEAFVGPRPPGLFGLHRDDDKANNELANLYWGSKSQNSVDFCRNARASGRSYPSDKLSATDVVMIKQALDAGESQKDIAIRFGVTRHNIGCIKLGKSWSQVTGIKRAA